MVICLEPQRHDINCAYSCLMQPILADSGFSSMAIPLKHIKTHLSLGRWNWVRTQVQASTRAGSGLTADWLATTGCPFCVRSWLAAWRVPVQCYVVCTKIEKVMCAFQRHGLWQVMGNGLVAFALLHFWQSRELISRRWRERWALQSQSWVWPYYLQD